MGFVSYSHLIFLISSQTLSVTVAPNFFWKLNGLIAAAEKKNSIRRCVPLTEATAGSLTHRLSSYTVLSFHVRPTTDTQTKPTNNERGSFSLIMKGDMIEA